MKLHINVSTLRFIGWFHITEQSFDHNPLFKVIGQLNSPLFLLKITFILRTSLGLLFLGVLSLCAFAAEFFYSRK